MIKGLAYIVCCQWIHELKILNILSTITVQPKNKLIAFINHFFKICLDNYPFPTVINSITKERLDKKMLINMTYTITSWADVHCKKWCINTVLLLLVIRMEISLRDKHHLPLLPLTSNSKLELKDIYFGRKTLPFFLLQFCISTNGHSKPTCFSVNLYFSISTFL